jgi:hypothetical protein
LTSEFRNKGGKRHENDSAATNPPFHVGKWTLDALGASAAVRYVDARSTSPTPPYTNWASAARVIQDAVDAASPGDEIVVTNGLYATGGRAVGTNVLVNRVAVDMPLTVGSVNGPQVTESPGSFAGHSPETRRG